MWNSSLDSPEGDLGGVRAHFDHEHTWFSHNLEFIAGFAPIRQISCQQLQDGPSPTHAQDGQDDVSLSKLLQII